MIANPKPCNRIFFEQSYGSISQANANRVEWLIFLYTLKEKAWM